jgi:two-component system, cell cycle sensor histidine kinase and response regulator CckA
MSTYDPAGDADKMRALIQLAASIADQLANVATSLAEEANILTKPGAERNLPAVAALIKRNVMRTNAIINSLRTFAGQLPTKPRVLDLPVVLAELTPMFESMLGPSVRLDVVCEADVRQIFADYTQLEQVLCTLVARARDAMPNGGAMAIRVANLPPSTASDFEASYVRMEVGDTGFAIPLLEHVFEPRLNRKSYGLWLGLSAVYGMVTQSHGRVVVESGPETGSKFVIFLPAYLKPRQVPSSGQAHEME